MNGTLPDAEEVVTTDDRATWLEARRKGLGGSDASTLAGVNTYSTLYALWLDKTGRVSDEDDNHLMRFGRLIEPVARQVFTEDKGVDVETHGMVRSIERPWQLYTPDGIAFDGGLWECKSVDWRLADRWADGQVADYAECQVQWGMDVTGLRHAWVTALIDREFVHRRVEYDPALAEQLRELGRAFWHDHVLADVEPAVAPLDVDTMRRQWAVGDPKEVAEADEGWLTKHLEALRWAAAAKKTAADEEARVKAELMRYMGDAETLASDGLAYVTWKTQESRRIDLDRLRAERPEIAAAYTNTTTTRVLRALTKPRKVH